MRVVLTLVALMSLVACGSSENEPMMVGDTIQALGTARACPTLADMAVDLESERSACFPLAVGQRGRIVEMSRGIAKVHLEGYRRQYFVRTAFVRRMAGAVGPTGAILPPRTDEPRST